MWLRNIELDPMGGLQTKLEMSPCCHRALLPEEARQTQAEARLGCPALGKLWRKDKGAVWAVVSGWEIGSGGLCGKTDSFRVSKGTGI